MRKTFAHARFPNRKERLGLRYEGRREFGGLCFFFRMFDGAIGIGSIGKLIETTLQPALRTSKTVAAIDSASTATPRAPTASAPWRR